MLNMVLSFGLGLSIRVFDWNEVLEVVILLRVEPVVATMRIQVPCGSEIVKDAICNAYVHTKCLC